MTGAWRAACVLIVASVIVACGGGEVEVTRDELWVAPDIEERRAQFVRQPLDAAIDHLGDGDVEALRHLIAAADAIDRIFWRQAWSDNPEFSRQVAELDGSGADAARDYYRIMYGPWDRLVEFEPFVGRRPRPEGAGYYPVNMDEAEFEAWLEAHPEDAETFTSLHTVIRRSPDGLEAVPYSVAYRELLDEAAAELRLAAAATEDDTLAEFLTLRADAFTTDDYFASDMAWMDLAGDLEVVIGPYETYEDTLFGYKAAFEAFLCVVQPEDSERLAVFKTELPFLERNLPIPDEHKNLDRGAESPIRVADEVYTAGDTRAGVQTLAFNLPNDERVREAKGSKKVLLKNMMHAKYEGILLPIAQRVLPADGRERVDFDAYFQFILMHELSHGLGPGRITIDGRETEVRLELKDLYSALEEAKADVLGVYNLYALRDRGVVAPEVIEALPWTYTAGLFRSARFGVTEAHGLGVVVQTGFLLEQGALEVTEEGTFRPVPERFDGAFRELARKLLMIQARGSYDEASALVERYGAVPDAMAAGIERLEDLPVDIDPSYPAAERLRAETGE